MESLTLLSELYNLAYPETISTSVDESHADKSADNIAAASGPEDSEESKQARVEAFMKHLGLEHCLDRIQKSATN